MPTAAPPAGPRPAPRRRLLGQLLWQWLRARGRCQRDRVAGQRVCDACDLGLEVGARALGLHEVAVAEDLVAADAVALRQLLDQVLERAQLGRRRPLAVAAADEVAEHADADGARVVVGAARRR